MDVRRREVERRASQGDPQARAEVLRARLRAGELARDALRLAAHLGEAAAAAALEEPLAASEATPLREWALSLRGWGQQAFLLGSVAALRAAAAGAPAAPAAAATARLDALAAWGRCPCPAHLRAAHDALSVLAEPNVGQTLAARANPAEWAVVSAARALARELDPTWEPEALVPTRIGQHEPGAARVVQLLRDADVLVEPRARGAHLELAIADDGRLGLTSLVRLLAPIAALEPAPLLRALRRVAGRSTLLAFAAERAGGEDQVRAAITTELLPWALGPR